MANSRTDLTPEDLVEMYRLMLMGRRFTERALSLYEEGRLPTALHPSIGQEAVGVGACYGLRPGDWVLPALRTTEAFWTRGVTMEQMLDAMLGNSGSISGGKESFHHCGYPRLGILAGSAIVGAQFPVAVGAALGLQMGGGDNVMVCFFGDGAAARGDFHEGLNLAALRRAPVVFVCENNLYFQTAPGSAGLPIEDVADRASSYGMPGLVVDGQDVLAVYDAAQEAIARARRGGGPTLLECKTYRFLRHYPTLRDTRPAAEVARWRRRDPITILAEHMRAEGYVDGDSVVEMERRIASEIARAINASYAKPPPEGDCAAAHVYSEPVERMGI